MAQRVAALGRPCVLDLGFATQADRAHFEALAREAGIGQRLHLLDIAAAERWRRTMARERSPSDTHWLPFAITREMFDFVEGLWQPPDAAEVARFDAVVVRE